MPAMPGDAGHSSAPAHASTHQERGKLNPALPRSAGRSRNEDGGRQNPSGELGIRREGARRPCGRGFARKILIRGSLRT